MTTVNQPIKRRNRRQDKRIRLLKKMAFWRAAKERKRIQNGPREEEPRMIPTTSLSWAMRDDLSDEVVWLPFKSVRDMAKRASMVKRFYVSGRFHA